MTTNGSPASKRRLRGVRTATWPIVALAVVSIVLSACSSSKSANKTSTSGGAENGSSQSLAAFNTKVDELIAKRSAAVTSLPPSSGPTAAKGKKVYIIACLQALEGCQRESKTAVQAGQVMGWDMKLIDTQSVPDKMNAAVQQAINDNVDGIAVEAIDMATLAGPLATAKSHGIKIVCFACVNSNDLAAQVIPSSQSFYDDGYALAAQMYKNTGGHPRILIISNKEVGVIANRQRGTEQFVADCVAAGGDCKIVSTQYFLFADLQTRVAGLVSGSLRQNPETNALWMAFDSTSAFITQGVQQAGVPRSKIGLYGFDGNIPNVHDIRTGGYEVATMAGPFEWVGWAEIDALNRLFHGQSPVDNVVVSKLMTKSNLPSTDTYSGDVDFRPAYLKVWAVSS
jgi:ribose transport system substrate-binding protein